MLIMSQMFNIKKYSIYIYIMHIDDLIVMAHNYFYTNNDDKYDILEINEDNINDIEDIKSTKKNNIDLINQLFNTEVKYLGRF